MRCQRCGFEIEPGQTFCSMCGTEQSRAIREKKKKKTPKSILWVVKVVSKGHLWMWLVLLFTILVTIGVSLFMDSSLEIVPVTICLSIVLIAYEVFYVLLGYKNPNTTKTKAYKVKYRMCAILTVLLLVCALFLDFAAIATAWAKMVSNS